MLDLGRRVAVLGQRDQPGSLGAIPNLPFVTFSHDSIVGVGEAGELDKDGNPTGFVTLTVLLIGSSPDTVTVEFETVAGTATAPSDYEYASGTLVFAPGETQKQIKVKIINDMVPEDTETFTVVLSNPSPNAVLGGGPATGSVITIVAIDDQVLPAVVFAQSSYFVTENGGFAVIDVFLTGSASALGPVTVKYQTSDGPSPNGAAAGLDYTTTSGTLTFSLAEIDKVLVVVVPIIDDGVPEANKTFTLELSEPTGATLGPQSTVTVTIMDDDVPPPVLWIQEAGAYIVPRATKNAVRYQWSSGAVPDAVTLTVYNKDAIPVRAIGGLPTSYDVGKNYAEKTWNGCIDESGTLPLTEADSPYMLQISATFNGNIVTSSPTIARVEEWKFDISIEDNPGGGETLVSGPDESTVNSATLELKISIISSNGTLQQMPLFTVTPNTASASGPSGNERACLVTPAYTFYTTPQTPYDIRYQLIIDQKTQTIDGEVFTVQDGAGNPWDMDPTQPGRQTRTTWEFGVDSTLGPPQNASKRSLWEKYE